MKDNPLHAAADQGQVPSIETLVRVGVDLEAKDEDGWTPLHFAAHKGRAAAIDAPIKSGAITTNDL